MRKWSARKVVCAKKYFSYDRFFFKLVLKIKAEKKLPLYLSTHLKEKLTIISEWIRWLNYYINSLCRKCWNVFSSGTVKSCVNICERWHNSLLQLCEVSCFFTIHLRIDSSCSVVALCRIVCIRCRTTIFSGRAKWLWPRPRVIGFCWLMSVCSLAGQFRTIHYQNIPLKAASLSLRNV